MRGEYPKLILKLIDYQGSPPLAWGILGEVSIMSAETRITPTCVGNTTFLGSVHVDFQDHPHLRGEYLTVRLGLALQLGSPPLAWGILYYSIINA